MHPTQLYDDGDWVQFAVSIVAPPAYGSGGLADNVQTGSAVGGCCHATITEAAGPKPEALRAFT